LSDDFKELESLVIKNQDLISFFNENKAMQLAFKAGGWIAGGFPREVFRLECSSDFSSEENKINLKNLKEEYLNRGGDIDFFFKDEQAVISLQDQELIKNYFYGGPFSFALTGHSFEPDTIINKFETRVSIQLVNKFFYKNIEETFREFDFYNSCYAIQKVNKEYVLTFLKKAIEFDKINTLKINSVNSPYTIQRVFKYLKTKNISKVEEESIHKIVELVYNLGFESFDKKYKFEQFKHKFFFYLKYMFEKLPLDPGIALVFLGKFEETVKVSNETYGPVITVDWARKVIQDCASTS